MYTYKKIILVFCFLLFSCAVQSLPTGGDPDTKGPYIKDINPPNRTEKLDLGKNIELTFNEMINPKTVKSSIKIFPKIDFKVSSFNNKIIIKPQNRWPENEIIKIQISRLIIQHQPTFKNY